MGERVRFWMWFIGLCAMMLVAASVAVSLATKARAETICLAYPDLVKAHHPHHRPYQPASGVQEIASAYDGDYPEGEADVSGEAGGHSVLLEPTQNQ